MERNITKKSVVTEKRLEEKNDHAIYKFSTKSIKFSIHAQN